MSAPTDPNTSTAVTGAVPPPRTEADPTAIRPFRVEVPEAEILELRRRIAATRWPSKKLVDDRSQGVQLATMQQLARYWLTDRSWAEKSYPTLMYFNEVERGGHFAAWEEPELFAAEVRAAFRPLRRPGS